MKSSSKIALIISSIFILCFFTLLFLNFYSKNYLDNVKKNIEKEEQEIIIENMVEEKEYDEQVLEKYEVNENEIKQSVFETDLKAKERKLTNSSNTKTLKYNKNGEKLTEEIVNKERELIIRYLFDGDLNTSIELAKAIENKYCFEGDSFLDFESFLCELKELEGYDELKDNKLRILLQKMKSPEIILFLYLSLSSGQKMNISENKNSEIFNRGTNVGYLIEITNCKKVGIDTSGAKDAYFVTSNLDCYGIYFNIMDKEYILYYALHNDTNTISILGIDDMSGDICSIKEYMASY